MPASSVDGADDLALDLVANLGETSSFTLPAVNLTSTPYQLPSRNNNPLYDDITKLANADLTTGVVGGAGTFDVLMTTYRAHLTDEYEKGRITGNQYAEVYTALTTAALSGAIQWTLGIEQTYWQSQLTKNQAAAAETVATQEAVRLETAKAELGITAYTMRKTISEIMVTKMQGALLDAQYTNTTKDSDIKDFTHSNILPAQESMVLEQMEAKRAETMDTRSDGVTDVVGSIGKQKDLYSQQIESYQRDAEYKVGKMFIDTWITQKTLDEGLPSPNNFTNPEIDEVISEIRRNVNLEGDDSISAVYE